MRFILPLTVAALRLAAAVADSFDPGQVAEIVTKEGKVEVIGMDFFDEGKHYMFCAFLPDRHSSSAPGKSIEEDSMIVLDNIHKNDCHSGVSMRIQMEMHGRPQGADKRPSAEEQRAYVHPQGAKHTAEPMNYVHASIHNILSVEGVAIGGFEAATTAATTAAAVTLGSVHHLKPQLAAVKQSAEEKKRQKAAAKVKSSSSLRGDARRLAKESGDSSLLVVRVLLNGDTGTNYCDETCAYNNAWGSDSSRTSYLEASYNELNIAASLGEIRTVSLSTGVSDYTNCNFDKLGDDAIAAVEAGGLSTSSFDMITFYMSRNIDCTFGGVAYVNGVRSWERSSFVGVLTHELGHTLGVIHSGTDADNDGIQDCEYCDYSCVMGSPSQHITMHAIHRHVLGWIPTSAVESAVSFDLCGTDDACISQHTLADVQTAPSAVTGSDKLILKLPRIYRPGDYYLSYRAGTGTDSRLLSAYKNKVSLHYYYGDNTELITTLGVSDEYVDSRSYMGVAVEHLRISVVSISGGKAVVEVDLGDANLPGCEDVTVQMTDSYGDGWNQNQLFFESTRFFSTSLESGFSATETVCLPPGTYSPFACTGTWQGEVGWTITYIENGQTKSITGGANTNCAASYGSFTVTAEGDGSPTLDPTFAPTDGPPVPTFQPSNAPSFQPADPTLAPTLQPSVPCTPVFLQLTDSYGDGWNGNNLYFNEEKTIWVTLSTGSGVSGNICLPDGVYTPYACDGTWQSEVSWSIPAYGFTGGATTPCQPNSLFFVVGAGSCTLVTVDMTDSSGDGWNGNLLYFDEAKTMALTLQDSLEIGTGTGCLPAGTYTPFACGGSAPEEVSWTVRGFDNPAVNGEATSTCPAAPTGPSFAVGLPTIAPTFAPTDTPDPTFAPTDSPDPTFAPTDSPDPTFAPTDSPDPTFAPTDSPDPTFAPTDSPDPTFAPTDSPDPTFAPTDSPDPTFAPSLAPTKQPSCPRGFIFDTVLWKCIFRRPRKLTNAQCSDLCSNKGANQLCINTPAESAHVFASYGASWIGINRKKSDNPQMSWKEPCFSTLIDNWASGLGPLDLGGVNTAILNGNGEWRLYGDRNKRICACESDP